MPIYGYGCDAEHDGHQGPETRLKVPPMGGGFWSTHISRMTFPKNLGWTPLKLISDIINVIIKLL